MRKITVVFVIIACFAVSFFAVNRVNNEKEQEAIKKVIKGAYIDGLSNLGDLEVIEKGFHPDFCIFYIRNNELKKYPIADWIEGYKSDKKKNPDGPKVKETIKFLRVDAIGNIGGAKFEVYKGSKLIFTDIMTLLKFNEGWRIVSKVSHSHQ